MNLKNLTLSAGLLALSLPALALRIKANDRDVQPGDVVVEKGETRSGDVAAKGSVTVRGTVTGDCAAFGGPLVVEGECRGEAASFGGAVRVPGRVRGDLASFGGPVDVSGQADGDVAVFGGDLTLRSSATVAGGVTVVGGRLSQEPGASIKGEVHDMDSRFLGALAPDIARAVTRAERRTEKHEHADRAVFPAFALALGLLTALLALFVPAQVENVAAAAAADFWRALGIGVLCAMGVMPGLVAMAVSVLGIPFIPVALAALAAALVLGTSAFYLLLSRRAFRNLGKPEPKTIPAVAWSAAGAFAILLATGFIPGLGDLLRLACFLTLLGGATLGLGGVWLTRYGTRPF